MEPTTPAIARLLMHFDIAHLPPHLAAASAPFGDAAQALVASWENDAPDVASEALTRVVMHLDTLGDDDEAREARSKAWQASSEMDHERCVRLLLEAKDCAVRAALVRHRAEQRATARETAERDHGTFLDSLTPEIREQALAFAEQTATEEWQTRLNPASDAGPPMAAAHEVEIREGLHRASIPVTPQTIAAFLEGQASRMPPEPPPLRYPATFHAWDGGWALRLGDKTIAGGTADTEREAAGELPQALRVYSLTSCMVTLGKPDDRITMEAGPGATMPDDEPHAVVDLGAVARASVADGDKRIATLGEAAAGLGVVVPSKRERLADFVVGIDVEQGPGLAALRGLVVELGAVADRLEAALPGVGFIPPTGPATPGPLCPDGKPCCNYVACVNAGGCTREG